MSDLAQRDYQPGARGILDGVRVLDLSRLFAGNVLTQILGDFGAEVIKVEPPEGDTLRAWKSEGIETHWKIYARNKKSLCLSMRDPRAVDLIRKLVPSCRIFVESFRPGVLEKMGLSPEALLELNPGLVLVRISGWGQDGPYSQRPGFGTVIEGFSGFASMNGFADREPVLPPMYLADGVAGLYGSSAAMIALREVEVNGGRGQVIDLPLLDPLFAILSPQVANYRLTGKVKPRTGSRSTNSAPRNAYRCSDGSYVGLSGSIQKMAERLFRAIGRPELVDDPRFRTNADRLAHADELEVIIGAFIGQMTQAETVAFFEKAEVTIGPIYDASQIVADPHVIERELVADYPDPEMGQLPMHAVVPRFLGTPGSIRTPAPQLGQHNREVLAGIGVADQAFEELTQAGVIRGGTSQPMPDKLID
ncbi:CoA transferase [Methylobacterium sp. NEAU 140]|uniref:CaiB/BaiF CoA transferase family protein n=1 Tax=Methylobacterium sp. NEAU 140 TaxID=3064945 RepID=UPI002733EB38|nr:CoA transferase [Methylobacterium sp. NEAU 140]MDP4026825.1 CoA transferase [Methylobacterium sp. NEAU 140]